MQPPWPLVFSSRLLRCIPRAASISLLGAASEEPQHNAGGNPIIVLHRVRPERSPVVVHVKQPDIPVPRRVHIQSAPGLERKCRARGRRVAASAAHGCFFVRPADQPLHKWRQTPPIVHSEGEPRAVVISIYYILGAARGLEAVAGICDDLQPRFHIPSKRAERPVKVRPVAHFAKTRK